jgi:hypothetical protein
MDPQHNAADTTQAHLHQRHCPKPKWISRDDASNEGATPVAPPSLTQTGRVFTPRAKCCEAGRSTMVPPTGRTTFRNAVTIATDRSVGESFRSVVPQTYNTHGRKTATHPNCLRNLQGEKKSGAAMNATMTPQANSDTGDTRCKPPGSTTMMMPTLQNSRERQAEQGRVE